MLVSQEVRILQDLHAMPHIVKCYPYNPRPGRGKQCSHLVMELMEVSICFDTVEDLKRAPKRSASTLRLLILA